MSNHEERRHYTRVNFASKAQILQDDRDYDVKVIDISLNGILIEPPENYTLKTEQVVLIRVELTDDVNIEMRARLAHNSNQLLGLQCVSIDMESMSHLRRLMELNIEDPSAPERVLDELIANA
ncbi:PilZ domain-containing protein [Agarilytica rhodophyticola]|uniref:PilZ domain-containing protein n=1 Tax=Agarilytica rhodophyticola TaxID=1737490 RepID=UPI000B344289|nr:PilZ domain-containing protein [Agarilytica rhodophyticola]